MKWRLNAAALLEQISGEARTRYEKLDAEVKESWLSGDLSPALVALGATEPT